nr:MAG TPA: hypothetical protein [Bacteriophage sp.]
MGRQAWAWRLWVWLARHGAGYLWARVRVGHGASVVVVGVPWLWQGRGRVGSPYKGIY